MEQTETIYRIEDAQTIEYRPNMIINNRLAVNCQFILEQSEYLNHERVQEKTHGILQLDFNSIINAENVLELNDKYHTNNVINKYCILVDRSQSMIRQNKLNNVKQSLYNLLDNNAKPNTQYALVSFGKSQKLHFKFSEVTKDNISNLKNEVRNINSTGQTDIVNVLQYAHSLIEEDITKDKSTQKISTENPIIRYSVVLLTDGFDNLKDKALSRIREFFKNKIMNYCINTLGFGDEHDPHLLAGIASHSGGKFYYIKTNEQIFPVFNEFISLQENVIVQDVDIEIQNNEQKTIQDQYNNTYKFKVKQQLEEVANDIDLQRIYFKQVRDGDEKNILLGTRYVIKHSDVYQQKISDNSSFLSDISVIQVPSQHNQDGFTHIQNTFSSQDIKQDHKKSDLEKKQNSQLSEQYPLIIQNSVKIGDVEDITKFNESNLSFISSFDDLSISSLNNSSISKIETNIEYLNKSEQQKTEIEHKNKEQKSDDYFVLDQKIASGSLDDGKKLNDLKIIAQKDQNNQNLIENEIIDQKNQLKVENKKSADLDQLKEDILIQQNTSNQNIKQNLNFKEEIEKQIIVQNIKNQIVDLTIGYIKVIFRFQNLLYQFYVPMNIRFTSQEINNPKIDERVAIQKLRSQYIISQIKSNKYLESGQAKKAIAQLISTKKALEADKYSNFPLYNNLVNDIEDSINKVQRYLQSNRDQEKEDFKRDIYISQQVNICHYLESTTTK